MIKIAIFLLMLTLVFTKKAEKAEGSGATKNEDVDEGDKRILMPGTKWCGMGNRAENDDDLGTFRDLDSCCRSHDKCKRKVNAFAKKYDYRNWRPFTVSDCECDSIFYDCLKACEEHPKAAKIVGNLFFNVLSMPCLKFNAAGTKATKGYSKSYK